MSKIDLSEVPNLQTRVNNALVNTTMNMGAYCSIQHLFRITENLYYVEALLPNMHYMIRFLVFDKSEHECSIFLEGQAFSALILRPMTQDIENAIKDYHSIGHA